MFPIDKCQQMEKLTFILRNYEWYRRDDDLVKELSKGIEPVHFRRISETKIEILDIEERKNI